MIFHSSATTIFTQPSNSLFQWGKYMFVKKKRKKVYSYQASLPLFLVVVGPTEIVCNKRSATWWQYCVNITCIGCTSTFHAAFIVGHVNCN